MTVGTMLLIGLMLAGLSHLILAAFWVRSGFARISADPSEKLLLLAASISVMWAWSGPMLAWLSVSWPEVEHRLDALRYGAWFFVLLYLLNAKREERLQSLLLTGAMWSAVLLVSLAFFSGSHLAFTLLSVFGLVLAEQLFRNLPTDSRWSIKPICLGLCGIFLFDFYLFSEAAILSLIDGDVLAARGFVHALMVPLLILSSWRQRRWIMQVRLSRQVVFHSVALSLAGGYLLFISALGYYIRYFGGDWGRALQVGFVFLSCGLLMTLAFSGSGRAWLRVWSGKHFLRYRYDYREEWLKFTGALASHSNPDELNQNVIQGLAGMVESPAGGLWMRHSERAEFVQVARWNLPLVREVEPVGSSLMAFVARSGWVIDIDEYRAHSDRYPNVDLPDWLMRLSDAWLLVPLRLAGDDCGFVVLARPRAALDRNWEVTDLLKTASTQAASFLLQMRATEVLMESRKFDSFNKMSAFVVHDLKNIVTQLSLLMKNARRLKDNAEFQDDMIMTIEHSLERMKQLMLQLREGGAPALAGTSPAVNLSSIAQEWALLTEKRGRKISLDISTNVSARGDRDRLSRVIGHVIQNALDATEANQGAVSVRTYRLGSQACIEVADQGCGMSEEFVRSRLFRPFHSTKDAGMGIGAYESAQYIHELGGQMKVDSQEGRGTLITVAVPLLESGEKE